MKNTTLMSLGACALLSLGGLACSSDDGPAPDGTGPEVIDAPDFGEGSGQPAWNEQDQSYPLATGYEIGSSLPNFEFIGFGDYRNANAGGQLQYAQMGDFYNPTGDATFPEGHTMAGKLKPKALVVLISSVWCPPCNYDAAEVLPTEYQTFQPMGGHIISVLIDGPTPGDAATIQHLTNWADSYLNDWQAPDGSVYSLFMDPAGKVMPLFEPAFPSHIIVRTSDMKIMRRLTGVAQPGGQFWVDFEGIINGTITE
jgi:hypothetical protein